MRTGFDELSTLLFICLGKTISLDSLTSQSLVWHLCSSRSTAFLIVICVCVCTVGAPYLSTWTSDSEAVRAPHTLPAAPRSVHSTLLRGSADPASRAEALRTQAHREGLHL